MSNNEDDVTTQMSNPNVPPCADYKQLMQMKGMFIKEHGEEQLKKDYETACRNSK